MEKEIIIYYGMNDSGEATNYYVYDPDTDVHYETTEEEYNKALANAE